MASIATYLAAIMDARYGEEVRSAIHDAIQAINEEATAAKEAAQTSQNSAQASATAAAASATNASSSASTAATQATNARNSASAAATSATNARNSASSAANSATEAGDALASIFMAEEAVFEAEYNVTAAVADAEATKNNLIRYRALYEPIEDATGNSILDSSGSALQGETLFVTASDLKSVEQKLEAVMSYLNFLNRSLLMTRIQRSEDLGSALTEHAILDSTPFNVTSVRTQTDDTNYS